MYKQPPSLSPQTKVPTSLTSISPHVVTTRSPTTLTPTKDNPPLTTLTISSPEEITTADDESKEASVDTTDEWKETQVNPLSQTQLKKEDSSGRVGATLSSVHIAIHVSFLVGIFFLSL